MKTFIALLPALALMASASPFRLANDNSSVEDVTPSIKDVPLSTKDVSLEPLAGNTTTPGIDSLPTCAVPCIEVAIKSASDCELDDLPCLCKNRAKIAKSAKKCILSTCGAKKTQKKVVPQVQALCKAEDKKEEERRKAEKKKEKEQEEARKKAEKEQKERDKKQREDEKKKEKEEKKKQKEKEKEEKRKKKEEEKKKKEEEKEFERLRKEEEKRKKEEEKRKKKEQEDAEAGENEKRDDNEERGEPDFTLEKVKAAHTWWKLDKEHPVKGEPF
ncbi:uncharacterized protein Triagg1_3262 [Trichoderma aggressivum f. europaeum]|uniref:CFEM domain-containing protein n=1 Tax=Trichoderma aggressivum f. europaeum TaxID=173218 RepID=A0AAE1IFQ9_9HYPO|nr:hypothetical protein Triagg1_3262 [Trichoderma aggressivum f. europaeum]